MKALKDYTRFISNGEELSFGSKKPTPKKPKTPKSKAFSGGASVARFSRKNVAMAIDASALGVDWRTGEPQPNAEMLSSEIAYVTIRGPMTHHVEVDENERPLFESYDALLKKFGEAFVHSVKVVFVSGDTPGGDVSGCFDGARQLYEMKQRWGGLLVWYVDGSTCSAGVAWSMAADYVVVPPEGRFGSIGVIAEISSFKKQAEAYGQRSKLITSGARKADGHPLNDISDETIEAVQASVDYEANIFYEWVSERRGIPVETIRGWEAGIFHGQEAVDVGLADEVAGESAALAMCAGVELTDAPEGAEIGDDMAAKSLAASAARALGIKPNQASVATSAEDGFDGIRKKLGKMAGEAGDDGKKARKALDAIDAAEEDSAEDDDPKEEPKKKHEEPDGDEGEDEGGEEASSSAESEDDEDDASSSAEDEEDSAKKCEDESKKAEAAAAEEDAKARSALASGAKDSSKAALRHMNRASTLRNDAKALRREAKGHRKMAAMAAILVQSAKQIDALTKAVAKVGKVNPSVAAINARGTVGTPPKAAKPEVTTTEAKGNVIDLSMFSAKERQAYGFEKQSLATMECDGETHLGLLSPTEANAFLAEQGQAIVAQTKARVARLTGGAK